GSRCGQARSTSPSRGLNARGFPRPDEVVLPVYTLGRGCERGTVRRCAASRTGPGELRRRASLSTTPSPVPAWSAAEEGCSGEAEQHTGRRRDGPDGTRCGAALRG